MVMYGSRWRTDSALNDSPFEKRASLPDVGVAHAAFRRFGDVFLLKELLDGLGHDCHSVVDVRRLVLAVDQLEAKQACPIDDTTQGLGFFNCKMHFFNSDVQRA